FFWYINHILPFYSGAIANVFSVGRRDSSGLAIGLVTITAMAGVLLDVFYRMYRSQLTAASTTQHTDTDANSSGATTEDAVPNSITSTIDRADHRLHVFLMCGVFFLIAGLLAYQMLVYYEYYRKTAGGSLPIAGALKAFCFAGTEVLALFAITHCLI